MPEVRIDIVWHSWWIGLESQRTSKRRHNGREQNGILLSRNQASVVRRETTASAVRQTRANNTGLYGSVVQLARTLACHARGHGFEPRRSRQGTLPNQKSLCSGQHCQMCSWLSQKVEVQIPQPSNICLFSPIGRDT